jgi:predicted SAM-dependent methyltransferase
MNMLNIACGSSYHKDWTNIDFHAVSEVVRKVNILNGLPYEDASFDAAYSSHFFEHLSTSQVDGVLQETYRILKIGGVLRLVVPDLENICREYLLRLEKVREKDDETNNELYDYIVVELLDQMVRSKPGGKLGELFRVMESKEELREYVSERTGAGRKEGKPAVAKRRITLSKIGNRLLYNYLKFIKLLIPKGIRESVFCGATIGELHKWMYDSYSLSNLLKRHGFREIQIHSFNTSGIPDFNRYFLDITAEGKPYKGSSSLFIEGIK